MKTPSKREVHLLRRSGVADWQEQCELAIDELLDIARAQGVFPALGKKRDEKYRILGANFTIGIERSASSLFGIVGLGVHMQVYTVVGGRLKFWVPQRNLNKSTYPGMLDNTVAGGVARDEVPFECLVREAAEEAALEEDMVRREARSVGSVTWFNISDEKAGGELGLMNPGLVYMYEMEVSEELVFKPVDGDVHAFVLMEADEVMVALNKQRFKPVCALVMLDFLIRHGALTTEDLETAQVSSRLHRSLPFPLRPNQRS